MDTEQEQKLDELFYRDSQWIADNGRYVHENNGAPGHLVLQAEGGTDAL